MSSSKVMSSTSKAPRHEHSMRCVQCSSTSLQGSNAPPKQCAPQIHHTDMITPSTQASISQVQASMQVIQVCPCHLGLNSLLQNAKCNLLQSKRSSKQATQPPCGHHEECHQDCLKVSNTPRKNATKASSKVSNPRVSHLHMCMSITEQPRVIHTLCTHIT
jgi:hypothetical protein